MMRKNQIVHDLSNSIFHYILSGRFGPGSPLPSVREIAQQLNINKSTVFLAYKDLQEKGYIYSRKGKGFYVSSDVRIDETSWEGSISEAIEPLLWQAKLAQLPKEELLKKIKLYITDNYEVSPIKVAFIECNKYEATEIAQDLERQIGVPVKPFMLDELPIKHREILSYPLILTTFFHLHEAKTLLKTREITAVHHIPSIQSVSEISNINKVDSVGIIATNERTMRIIKGVLSVYQRDFRQSATVDQPEKVNEILKECNIVIINPEIYTHYDENTFANHKIIPVHFQIENQSIRFIKEKLNKIQKK
ncbi:GntR family transcriptional regulator [Bacillus shivajii]|uniref:GntR family transcriptional regulator n=1 Tax=Bacillus shivajii TaxID=1983719 RepID=UPI001CFBCF47|nr:GntR family transcriptional regulator [Bacillus shivajii]UCZ52910.1 GntR family transcriptional regulator [Bacillus shivajii]